MPGDPSKLAGRLRTADGVEVVVTLHAARRYRERVDPRLAGWPEAMARLRWVARREGAIVDDRPDWLEERDDDRGGNRWLLVGEGVAMPLRGRKRPKATTCLASPAVSALATARRPPQ